MYRRAVIVDEPRDRRFDRPRPTADLILCFQNEDRQASGCQNSGRGKSIGTRANNNGVMFCGHLSPNRTSRPALLKHNTV